MGKRDEGRSEWSETLELGPRQQGVPDAGSDKEGVPDTAQQSPPRRRFGEGLVASRVRNPSTAFSTFSPLPLRQQCMDCKDKDLVISQLRKELEDAEVGRERLARISKELEAAKKELQDAEVGRERYTRMSQDLEASKKDRNILSGELAAVNKKLHEASADTADTATMLQVLLGEYDVQVQQGYIQHGTLLCLTAEVNQYRESAMASGCSRPFQAVQQQPTAERQLEQEAIGRGNFYEMMKTFRLDSVLKSVRFNMALQPQQDGARDTLRRLGWKRYYDPSTTLLGPVTKMMREEIWLQDQQHQAAAAHHTTPAAKEGPVPVTAGDTSRDKEVKKDTHRREERGDSSRDKKSRSQEKPAAEKSVGKQGNGKRLR